MLINIRNLNEPRNKAKPNWTQKLYYVGVEGDGTAIHYTTWPIKPKQISRKFVIFVFVSPYFLFSIRTVASLREIYCKLIVT